MNNSKGIRIRGFDCDSGASATEFSLLLPLLMILLFGFFEIGRLIWSYNIVSASVRDAGRYAARQNVDCTTNAFVDADAAGNVKRLARTGTIDSGGQPKLPTWTDDNSVTITITCLPNPTGGTTYAGLYKDLDKIPTVDVAVVAPYESNLTGLIPINLANIRVNHAEAWTQQ